MRAELFQQFSADVETAARNRVDETGVSEGSEAVCRLHYLYIRV